MCKTCWCNNCFNLFQDEEEEDTTPCGAVHLTRLIKDEESDLAAMDPQVVAFKHSKMILLKVRILSAFNCSNNNVSSELMCKTGWYNNCFNTISA